MFRVGPTCEGAFVPHKCTEPTRKKRLNEKCQHNKINHLMLNNSSFYLIKRFRLFAIGSRFDGEMQIAYTNICPFLAVCVNCTRRLATQRVSLALGCFLFYHLHMHASGARHNNNKWPTQRFLTECINQKTNSDVENHPQQLIGYCYTNNKLSAATKEPTK